MKKAVKQRFFKGFAALRQVAKNLLTAQKGATLIEIALYAALVVIVCIAVIASLGDRLQGVFNTIVNSL